MIKFLSFGAFLSLFVAVSVQAVESIGRITALRGDVVAVSGSGVRTPLSVNAPVYQNQTVITAKGAKVQVVLKDESVFTVGPDTELVLDKFVYDPVSGQGESVVESTKGVFKFLTGKIAKKQPEKVKLNTPFATIGVRGSGGIVQIDATGQTTLNMTECCLSLSSRDGTGEVVALNRINTYSKVASKGAAPTAPEEASLQMRMTMESAVNLDVNATEGSEIPAAEKAQEKSTAKEVEKEDEEQADRGEKALPEEKEVKKESVEQRTENNASSKDEKIVKTSAAVPDKLAIFSPEKVEQKQDETPAFVEDSNDALLNAIEARLVEVEGVLESSVETVNSNQNDIREGLVGVAPADPIEMDGGIQYVSKENVQFLDTLSGRRMILNLDGRIMSVPLSGPKGRAVQLDIRVNEQLRTAQVVRGFDGDFYRIKFMDEGGEQDIVIGNATTADAVQNAGLIRQYAILPENGMSSENVLKGSNLVVDTTGVSKQVVGGRVDFSSGKMRSFVGRIDQDGINGNEIRTVDGQVDVVSLEDTVLFGSEDNLDGFGLKDDVNDYTHSYAVATQSGAQAEVETDAILAKRDTSNVFHGYAAGHMLTGDGYERVSNNADLTKVTFEQNQDEQIVFDGNITVDGDRSYYSHFTSGAYVGGDIWSAESDSGSIGEYGAVSSQGSVLSSAFVDFTGSGAQDCVGCDYVSWGVWSGSMVHGDDMFVAELIPFVLGDVTTGLTAIQNAGKTGEYTYKGVLAGSVTKDGSINHHLGNFDAQVNFGNRKVSGFSGDFGGYHLEQSGYVEVSDAGEATFATDMVLDVTHGDDTGTGSATGALFGPTGENIGGNFKFDTEQSASGVGVYAGAAQ